MSTEMTVRSLLIKITCGVEAAERANQAWTVAAMGVAEDGQMALPPDPRTIGWYRYGAGPGDRVGSVVLGGHLDSREYGVGPAPLSCTSQRAPLGPTSSPSINARPSPSWPAQFPN